MITKLKAKRFNLRRPDPAAEPPVPPMPRRVAPTARAQISPAAASAAAPRVAPRKPVAPADDMPFSPGADDDGFGGQKFNTAKGGATPEAAPAPQGGEGGVDIDRIRKEGLTGRQLRLARRLAQKHGLPATSDFDAVRLLRAAGIDPFQKSSILELITAVDSEPAAAKPEGSRALAVTQTDPKLPQTVKPIKPPSTEARAEQSHLADLQRIQQDLARRRRRKSALLMMRMFFFVFLPTLLAGWYYYMVATPLYATRAEFVIQQAQASAGGAGGLGGLLSGTSLATSQDSFAVQGYLQSRDAMLRLDEDLHFRDTFGSEQIDPIQRLPANSTLEQAYRVYKRNVKISYDPTEGIIKMEVIAPDPNLSAEFSEKLIGYAEEQVDALTQRLRNNQMAGAQEAYEKAQGALLEAQRKVVELQERFKTISSEAEISLVTAQIGQLESQLTQDRLSLAQMETNANPNAARMDPIRRRIVTLENEIAQLRARMTERQEGTESIARVQSELLVAQADVQTRQLLLAQSLQAMETSRIEANRQVRYLSLSVTPIPPDEPTYPRAFENTIVALLVFVGIYLFISMTVAILREQVTA